MKRSNRKKMTKILYIREMDGSLQRSAILELRYI